MSRREASQNRKFVNQSTNGLDGAADRIRTGADDLHRSRVGRGAALEVPPYPFCRQRDRRERVLDFVRYTACDLTPCRLLLRFEQVRQVFEHQDISQALTRDLKRSNGHGYIQFHPWHSHFPLCGGGSHTIGTAE